MAAQRELKKGPYRLMIFAADARTVKRVTMHETYAAAYRSLVRYERRHGRHCNVIDKLPLPDANDADGWDRYRLRWGMAGA